MSADPKKFYLTTPIYYVNARPHIGHAYTTIVADVLARRHRLLGDDTFFLTGTDEHGQKIERSAAAAGIPPQEFTDKVAAEFEDLWKRMGITHNKFIRTTDPAHAYGVQKLFSELYKNKFIELKAYTGTYCVSDETFVDVPAGTPCPDCGRITETVTEENFFFKLSAFQEKLINLIESDELMIENGARRNEVLSFLRGNIASVFEPNELKKSFADNPVSFDEMGREAVKLGRAKEYAPGKFLVLGALKDLSVSRSSFTWGIPVPEPAASDAKDKHVIYVWLDALANYITALGYGSDNTINFEKFWPADLQLVGKEIIRFHCVYWPAFLLAADLPLPKAITAHGWLLFDNSKMSKSKGNIVRTETILDVFGDNVYGTQFPDSTKVERDLFASDVLRYFLLREIPFGQDGSFSFDALLTRYNADLANGYGNLVSRVLNMVHANFEGAIPDYPSDELKEPKGIPLSALFDGAANTTNFTRLLSDITGFIGHVDGRITSTAPWKLAKSDLPEDRIKLKIELNTACEAIQIITAYLYPIIPYATSKVWAQLGLGHIELAARNGVLRNIQTDGLKPGAKLGPLSPIFPRADKSLIEIMTNMEEQNAPTVPTAEATPTATATPAPAPAAPTTPEISIDDFAKIELRVAQIVVAERIPKADKLLRLEVDLGPDLPRRQILSGIAEHYTPEELIGRRIVVITNLAPRKMRGLESHGMLLAASHGENGKPILATFAEDIALGSRLK